MFTHSLSLAKAGRRGRWQWPSLACLVALCICEGVSKAEPPPGYYNSAEGVTGAALRVALHNIIDGHTVISYSATRVPLENLDQDPANSANLILLYERSSWPKSQFISNTPGGWNREHCWPNSLGIDDDLPAYSDLFNLRACGEPSNSDRGNLYYDESLPASGNYQNPAGPTSPMCSQDFDSWEAPLEVKGDLARAMFYMDVRYEGDSGEPNLALTENIGLISTSADFMGRLSTLLLWHFLDPVSPAERTRLEGTFGYQGNRNPFVDRPEWVEAIFGKVLELRSAIDGDFVVLSWPALLPQDISFIESSADLVQWMPATLTVTEEGGWRSARVPLADAPRFYRLKLRERAG